MSKISTDLREATFLLIQYNSLAIIIGGLAGALSFFFPLFAYLHGAIIGLVVLEKKTREALIVGIGAAAIALFMAFSSINILGPHKVDVVLPLLLTLWLPNFVSMLILRASRSLTVTFLIVGFFIVLFVVGTHSVADNMSLWWKKWLEQHISLVPGATVQGFVNEGALELMDGFVAMFFEASLICTVLLARKWQSFLNQATTFRTELSSLKLPRILTGLIVILGILITVEILPGPGSVWVDLLMVAIMLYFFQGVAALYAILASKKLSGWWLILLYIALFSAPTLIIKGVALIGIIRSLVDLNIFSSSDNIHA
ncbi:DUF2232 domain-containing protein [Candidatus Nitrosacidococcus tergens]|uniref:DUF2232 domain-containing protein n=1 Tax=Candidatus Nitrosacidococcus tergens TaxID=553981 RepID=A0A7G1QAT7_9GAMM|nr:DUF2232 domain-containing protein [Candidatus Nitrosacidococcus tergens]CAB1276913.1 conserved membrane protein of unknown function [Candidatus Nitrosacidococcus tergens]